MIAGVMRGLLRSVANGDAPSFSPANKHRLHDSTATRRTRVGPGAWTRRAAQPYPTLLSSTYRVHLGSSSSDKENRRGYHSIHRFQRRARLVSPLGAGQDVAGPGRRWERGWGEAASGRLRTLLPRAEWSRNPRPTFDSPPISAPAASSPLLAQFPHRTQPSALSVLDDQRPVRPFLRLLIVPLADRRAPDLSRPRSAPRFPSFVPTPPRPNLNPSYHSKGTLHSPRSMDARLTRLFRCLTPVRTMSTLPSLPSRRSAMRVRIYPFFSDVELA
jgi:hypothetical protein